MGRDSLRLNTTASNNTAVGYQAGYSNTTGPSNTIMGYQAGYTNTTGSASVFLGYTAGINASGGSNTFVGAESGYYVTSGTKNTIIGRYTGNQGGLDIRTSSNYIVLSDGDGNPNLVINPSGNVGIGTISPSGKLGLTDNSANPTLYITQQSAGAFPIEALQTNASYTGAGIRSRVTTKGSGTDYYTFSYYNDVSGNYLFRVLGNGNVQNTNNSYGAISDVKLKENIVDATPKLEDLCKVKVRNYNLIGNNTKQIGVVAQELEEVFAGLVEETQDRDVDGNDLGTTTKQVKYSVFVQMLIKAIQELKAEVDSLKQQLGK